MENKTQITFGNLLERWWLITSENCSLEQFTYVLTHPSFNGHKLTRRILSKTYGVSRTRNPTKKISTNVWVWALMFDPDFDISNETLTFQSMGGVYRLLYWNNFC